MLTSWTTCSTRTSPERCQTNHQHSPTERCSTCFDCAVACHGTSLNDKLLQGPDLTSNLFGVLTHFRQDLEPVALIADIESMFQQVKVCSEDRNALHFLWWPQNYLNSEPEEFQIMVHLFGATSSLSCSNFALPKTADDNSSDVDDTVTDTVKRNFYVTSRRMQSNCSGQSSS